MSKRELMFCAGSGSCTTARMMERGTVFYCARHQPNASTSLGGPEVGFRPGDAVLAKDRRNEGVIIAVDGSTATVRFGGGQRGTSVEVQLSTDWLEKLPSAS